MDSKLIYDLAVRAKKSLREGYHAEVRMSLNKIIDITAPNYTSGCSIHLVPTQMIFAGDSHSIKSTFKQFFGYEPKAATILVEVCISSPNNSNWAFKSTFISRYWPAKYFFGLKDGEVVNYHIHNAKGEGELLTAKLDQSPSKIQTVFDAMLDSLRKTPHHSPIPSSIKALLKTGFFEKDITNIHRLKYKTNTSFESLYKLNFEGWESFNELPDQ